MSKSEEGFAPPSPFGMEELDPAGVLPERLYTRDELLTYLEHGRQKCRYRIASLTAEQARKRCAFGWLDISVEELLLYTMRHVQHNAAQLNLMLRQKIDSAPRWVRKTKVPLDGE
ncbi:MAG: DinB family protein [Candidatus Zixiibacteriota bacterium]